MAGELIFGPFNILSILAPSRRRQQQHQQPEVAAAVADERRQGGTRVVRHYYQHELLITMPDPYAVDINIFVGGLRVVQTDGGVDHIVKYPKKKTKHAQKRKEVAANKSAQKNKRKKT